MMDRLPEEIISRIMQYLTVPERKEAALVCRNWYSASLNPLLLKDVIVRRKPMENDSLKTLSLITHRLTHLEFADWEGQRVTEETLLSLLRKCTNLELLDLSGCNNLFLSGRLLSRESDIKILRHNLASVRVLKLDGLRHMTDVTFERLVSVMENLERITLSSVNMIFGSSLYKVNHCSPAMLHFSTFLKFVDDRANKLRSIDISNTAVDDEALGCIGKDSRLTLHEISLKGCSKISDKGLKLLALNQHSLQILDVSDCKEIGNDKDLFRNLADNLPTLHTLKMRRCTKICQCDIASLSCFPYLHTVDLGEVSKIFTRELIKGLCYPVARLKSLSLSACPDVNDEFVIHLCKSNYDLIELDLTSCTRLTDASLHAITRSLTSLQILRLGYCRELSDIGVLGYIPENGVVPRFTFDFDHDGCPCTRERDSTIFRKPIGAIREHKFCMSKAHISVSNGEDLYNLSNLKSLRLLDLSYCPRITDVGIAEAVKFKELRSLFLNGLPRISHRGIKAVACHNASLEDVKLACNPSITDEGIDELLTSCPKLSSLDLKQCTGLSNGCLKAVSAYGKKIHHLDLSFNHLVPKAVMSLQDNLPKTKIVFKPHFD